VVLEEGALVVVDALVWDVDERSRRVLKAQRRVAGAGAERSRRA